MTEKLWATLIIMIGATLMIIARRYKNNNLDAGYGIAGWTMFIILCIWTWK